MMKNGLRQRLILLACIFVGGIRAEACARGIVTFTVDDALASVYHNAVSLFERYDVRPTLFVITEKVESDSWFMTWKHVQELHALGWEIGSHSATHPSLPTLNDVALQYELTSSKRALAIRGIEAHSFASPFGDVDERTIRTIRQEYAIHRRTWGNGVDNGLNTIHNPDWMNIVALVLTPTIPATSVIAFIERAVREDLWLVLCLHGIVHDNATGYQYSSTELERILEFVHSNGITTKTLQAMRYDK